MVELFILRGMHIFIELNQNDQIGQQRTDDLIKNQTKMQSIHTSIKWNHFITNRTEQAHIQLDYSACHLIAIAVQNGQRKLTDLKSIFHFCMYNNLVIAIMTLTYN